MVHCSLKRNGLLRDLYANAVSEKALPVRLARPREVPDAEWSFIPPSIIQRISQHSAQYKCPSAVALSQALASQTRLCTGDRPHNNDTKRWYLIDMSILHKPLFPLPSQGSLGIGFHNVGREGVLRASNESMVNVVQTYYGQRCGHLPLNAGVRHALVSTHTEEIHAQMSYLSSLFGKDVTPLTLDDLKQARERTPEQVPLIVPYINVPELEQSLGEGLGAKLWGLPGPMTHLLKNKASFYQLIDRLGLDGFSLPDYTVATIDHVASEAGRFLQHVEEIYQEADMVGIYPLGVMLRAAEEDGNYGCCLVYENAGNITVVQDGDADHARHYASWQEALAISQEHLAATMNVQKEARVVISRYLDVADSPGLSVVILENHVESLGWNSQLQKPGSKACIGTSTYTPANDYARAMQQVHEEQTAIFFEALLRETAHLCEKDFASIVGVANLDIMIPGALERRLQQQRKQPVSNYLAECNPRWTNYTDAILTVLGATHREPTISNMRATIAAGICTIDKYPLPTHVDPSSLRASIADRDRMLQREGTRIICRMAKNPMGLIFAGNLALAEREMQTLLN